MSDDEDDYPISWSTRILGALFRIRAAPSRHAPGSLAAFEASVESCTRDLGRIAPALARAHSPLAFAVTLCGYASRCLDLAVRDQIMTEPEARRIRDAFGDGTLFRSKASPADESVAD